MSVLSVVIVNWNTRELLRACLNSLREHPAPFPTETIVVDNASRDGSADMVKAEFPEVTLLAENSNLGYAAGNNRGFAAASGELILALNPDTEMQRDTLRQACALLLRDRHAGSLAGKLIGPEGDVQASVRGFPSFLGVLADLTGIGHLMPAIDTYRLRRFDYARRQYAPQPMGTFLMFKREALATVGEPGRPFDERFPLFFNEVDLLYRLDQKGWKCIYAPEVEVLHHGGASTKQVRPAAIWESHRSLSRYFEKHTSGPSRLLLPLIRAANWLGAWLRTGKVHAGFRA